MRFDTRVDGHDILRPLDECGGSTDEECYWAQSPTRLTRLSFSATPRLLSIRVSLFCEPCRIQISRKHFDALTIEVTKATLAQSTPLLDGNVQPVNIKCQCGIT
jgi:hypothetical protein